MNFLALAALSAVTLAVPPLFGGRPPGGFTAHIHSNNANIDPASHKTGSEWITQKLDHSDSISVKTWQQQYFFNYEFAVEGSNVNVLFIGGEANAGVQFIVGDNSYVYYASQLNATLYALEHRYYGASHPTEDLSDDNLKYLTSLQAIEDIAEFIRQKNDEKGGDQKWIVVGGSYAGALSAWSRLLHPELIAGALSSSAPILAQMDFYGYLQTVDEDVNKLGGPCHKQLEDAIIEVGNLLQTPEGRQKLTALFLLYPRLSDFDDLTNNDISTFYRYLITPFISAAQNNFPILSDLCRSFTVHGPDYDPVKALKSINPYTSMNINFTHAVLELSGVKYEGDTSNRLWLYQTCNEFGFFQSSDRGSNIFGQSQPSNTFIEYCQQVFGIGVDQIQKNVEATNRYYGERDYYAGTNVLFSHGTQDPWSFLSKKGDPKHWSVVIVEIEGGAHVSDLGLSCTIGEDFCSDNMQQIQTLTLENMKRWIDPIFPVPDRVEITDDVGKRPQLFDPNFNPYLQAKVIASDSKIRAKRSGESPKVSNKVDITRWNKFTGKGRKVLLPPPVSEEIEIAESAGNDWIEQTWDHFNPNEERTFKQQWFYNYQYGSAGGPNFLMIGGEGPEDMYWVSHESLSWMTYAKAVGANLFLLEHRYYGRSKLGTNDLQYLTSAQMLYDVAAFIRTQQVKQNRTGPWITFGGSYPGALAAWSREWFPELILGAVGSSGPVLAKTDFYEYLEVVEDVIGRQSQNCFDRTAEAFNSLHKLSQDPEGRAIIQEKLMLWPEWSSDANETIDPLDMNEVFSALYGIYQGTVQYNDVSWQAVSDLCSFFDDGKYVDSLDALSALRNSTYGDDAILSSFNLDVRYLAQLTNFVDGHDPSYSDDDIAGVLWTWQTCNEFGYYQTTDYGDGIFGTPVPINFFVIMCERVFEVGMDQIGKGVNKSNYQYGGINRYNTTNVVLPNGDADPWHALGLLERGNNDESVVPIVIKGTSHCADMYGETKNDPPELIQARKTILENIQKWLAPTPSPTANYASTTVVPSTITTTTTQKPGESLTETTAQTNGRPTSAPSTRAETTITTTTSVASKSALLIIPLLFSSAFAF